MPLFSWLCCRAVLGSHSGCVGGRCVGCDRWLLRAAGCTYSTATAWMGVGGNNLRQSSLLPPTTAKLKGWGSRQMEIGVGVCGKLFGDFSSENQTSPDIRMQIRRKEKIQLNRFCVLDSLTDLTFPKCYVTPSHILRTPTHFFLVGVGILKNKK